MGSPPLLFLDYGKFLGGCAGGTVQRKTAAFLQRLARIYTGVC